MDSRYVRQTALIGEAAQQKLRGARIAVVGAGGLGSPALLYLAGAGVGSIVLIDDDAVALSNLHRQVIHTTGTVGDAKVLSAMDALEALNPDTEVDPVRTRLTWDNAVAQLASADMVLDGSDNFDTRHVISHAAARLGIPHIWGSILGVEAQLSVFWAGHGPVYEDLFPAPPPPGSVPSCSQAGVLGPLVGVVGSAMAMEALKLATGMGTPLVGTLGYFDGLAGTWEYVPLNADPAVTERVRELDPPHGPAEVGSIPPGAVLIDVREPSEYATDHIRGAINVPLGRVLDGYTPPELAGGGVLICASGARSARAVAALEARGVRGVASLRGGMDGLRR
ncbi:MULTISPECIES: ThiF family adenylyltransferase [Corynebacterium]|uniref:Molybdopterin biosynthesis protein MoeB n=1 Tax=Corynebacterium gottingense TaxID=2041036 RepID=A0ABX9ULM5_9CORY|nr:MULTISPECIES: ThiF family adenylyltransferase [Corynebacterium]PAT15688.1 molybdopterin biosynthesis protein MoeB [Corynebacterium sp. NML 120412]RMD19724.1 molybdopterin biosynthesis protein MoeB [Corynebacterium gottingense]WJZ12900.1 putative adenylyltransferase/sulfurtransferase MoeZ [Corynebacterium gottingense]WJZ15225.1 putative adenylyltransferase/sulfurtransferase MoeZ [Corynebacterium gottingense]